MSNNGVVDGFGKNRIRVLCVFATLDSGGAETMCMNLYRNINRKSVQFDFVKHTHEKGIYEEEIASLGGRIYEAPTYQIYNHFSYCAWWKNHLENHPEHIIIHGHYYTIASVFSCIAKRMGRVVVVHAHTSNPVYKGMKGILKQYLIARNEKFSDYAFACSKEAGEWMFPDMEFTVLNNAIDADVFSYNKKVRMSIRRQLGIEDELVLGTVGRFCKVKNPEGVLEIVDRVRRRRSDIMFIWVGDGELKGRIEKEIQARGLSGYMILTGVQRDVNRILQAMDIFILPSIYEGLPVSCIEAQAAGLHCLLSDAVARDADITGLCRFLTIEDYSIWEKEILNLDIMYRSSTKEKIVGAGYDIQATAQWLENFYINILKTYCIGHII